MTLGCSIAWDLTAGEELGQEELRGIEFLFFYCTDSVTFHGAWHEVVPTKRCPDPNHDIYFVTDQSLCS
jgi:hypothetical protein